MKVATSVIGVVGILLGVTVGVPHLTKEVETLKVVKTERITQGDDQKYMVYTEEGVYENTDTLAFFKYSSADLYRDLREGESYQCLTYGFRIPFFSVYPNIVTCEK